MTAQRQQLDPELTLKQELVAIREKLDLICAEIDVCFRAMHALLLERNATKTADKLADEFEALHRERAEARDAEAEKRDTQPPGPTG